MIDLRRLKQTLDTEKLRHATVGIFGLGGGTDFAVDLARNGVGNFRLTDLDVVGAENIARQGFQQADVGTPKVKATAKKIKAVNAEASVLYFHMDCTKLTDEEADALFGDCDVLIAATDNLEAQVWINRLALRDGIPAVWVGLYPSGAAGEIIFWKPGLDCYHCLCEHRIRKHEAAAEERRSLDPPSDGVTRFDVGIVDAIAGHIVLGLLTEGSDNRFGRLIERLGDRNFLQIKLDPDWQLNGRDVIRRGLGIAEECDAYISWCTIACRNGATLMPCRDCVELRGHRFEETNCGEFSVFHRTDYGVDRDLVGGKELSAAADETTPQEEEAESVSKRAADDPQVEQELGF
ncbi:Molybdopterin-synthase adenylyltransferase [Symmachiella dynata]|uniref:Molybdopterin-synthase adenylyltransferase n=1 Tax=Symmachiella dynata TaxID=2527995 RepID=A0A517ZKC5_9PLAN|nr:ThiF family adenylyltransferase [Symmachiella dynata]QDU42907.1 Molybdopterin-synthase adenylyltransferase [Symmachiella dynata]